jgi:hypothetical protein
MSKGNMFVGSAKGRVGNLVLYTRKGSQITRAYQSTVKNPKTSGQMIQRAKFSNAVKFYQKAVQHFFKFAYQDQKQTETAFNAFMRHNVDRACLLRKDEVNDPYFPAFGRWIMSQGSLAAPMVPIFSDLDCLFANTGIKQTVKTVADLSSVLIGQGYHVGDIITFVGISSLVTSVDFDLSNYYDSGNLVQPQWDIRQLIVSTSDQTAISDIPSLGPSVGELYATDGGLQFDFNNPEYSNAAAVIATRKGSGVTYASNAELVPNSVTLAMINATSTSAWIAEVTASWQSQGDAILQGSVANSRTRAEGSSGTGTTGGSTTGGTTAESVINTINGGSKPVSITEAGKTAVTIVGNKLSTLAPTATGEGISIDTFSVNPTATSATFNIVVAENYSSGSVSYMGKTVAIIDDAL